MAGDVRSQVGVLEKRDEVGLGRLLESEHGRRLEAQVRLEVLSNLSHKTLEGQLADELREGGQRCQTVTRSLRSELRGD